MTRRTTFTVDAESVQGNPGTTVTFRAIKVREFREYTTEADVTDRVMLERHLAAWTGIVDDGGNELPSPADDPSVLGELYIHEQQALMRLLWAGPEGASAKN